jgi:hypothetical protein
MPRSFLSTLKAEFFSLAQTGLETALLAGLPSCGMECRQRLWMSITGSSSGDECDEPDVATTPKGTQKETPRPPGP